MAKPLIRNGGSNPYGRPMLISDPAYLKALCELLACGLSRQEICDELGLKDTDTITRWKKDPRVRNLTQKLIEERAIDISRKVDQIINGRLSQAQALSISELIKIRQEYGGSRLRSKEIIDDTITADAMLAMEQNPDLADQLQALLSGPEV